MNFVDKGTQHQNATIMIPKVDVMSEGIWWLTLLQELMLPNDLYSKRQR